MLFNSFAFLAFFPVFFGLYMALRKRVACRNLLLLVASYFFYGWWDYRFLSLLVLSTGINFFSAWMIHHSPRQRVRMLLLLFSVAANLGILSFFKYAGFFVTSAQEALAGLGLTLQMSTLHIILPVGISFYTFQTMGYTIDVYRRSIEPAGSFLNFAVYVAFFPQLVAGPIERARNLLPQIESLRPITATDIGVGSWLILFGYFKKVVIADNLGLAVDPIFNNHQQFAGLDVVLAAAGFAFQIYADFSGYSDIARGLARCLGFHLVVNFRVPYLSRSPSEFWQRWHISLSTWLRDYLYISLGGNRKGRFRTSVNLLLTMLLGGLWHGAAWTFAAWGLFHGVILVLYRWSGFESGEGNPSGWIRLIWPALSWAVMMLLTLVGWLLFRASGISSAWEMLTSVNASASPNTTTLALHVAAFSLPLILFDVWSQVTGDLLAPLRLRTGLRVILFVVLLSAIVLLGYQGESEFIYFQF